MKTTTFSFLFMLLFASTLLHAQESSARIIFSEKNLELKLNDSIPLEVKFITDSTEVILADSSISVHPWFLGKVENGFFYALKPGIACVKARYQNYADSIRVKIEREDDIVDNNSEPVNDTIIVNGDTINVEGGAVVIDGDTIQLNVVRISRVLPSGRILPAHAIYEGQKYVIGGLPVPMNILNGGEILFPPGSLKEDINIRVELPKFAEINRNDSVTFRNKKVLNSVSFHVYVNDSLVSPYYFEKPLEVAIPFKRGLIRHLGLDPAKLSLYYASDSLVFDHNGISDVVIDSAANMIRSKVAHFSNLVIAEGSEISGVSSPVAQLINVFPNPVENVINVRLDNFAVGVKTVKLYNLMGQNFINRQIYTTQSQFDISDLPSGIYLVKITNESDELIYTGRISKK